MARTAARTASVYVRLDPEVKAEAEALLEQMGLPMSNAVDMFLRQLVIQRRLPIDTRIPRKNPVSIDEMTKEEIGARLSESIRQVENGEIVPHEEITARFRHTSSFDQKDVL